MFTSEPSVYFFSCSLEGFFLESQGNLGVEYVHLASEDHTVLHEIVCTNCVHVRSKQSHGVTNLRTLVNGN
jgi:hypothetical protein